MYILTNENRILGGKISHNSGFVEGYLCFIYALKNWNVEEYINCSTFHVYSSTFLHSSIFHQSLEQRCRNIVEKQTVEEYMYSSTLHINVIIKSIYPHSKHCLYYSEFIDSSTFHNPQYYSTFQNIIKKIVPQSTILFYIPKYYKENCSTLAFMPKNVFL